MRDTRSPLRHSPLWLARLLAREILDTIAGVRRLRGLGSRAGIDAALTAAMRVGWLAAEMEAKGWPLVTLGRQARTAKQKGGLARGQQVSKIARASAAEITRHHRRFQQSDELQSAYRTATAYIATKVPGVTKRTINKIISRRPDRESS